MQAYLNAEIAFIRMFGSRSLLLLLICALCRTGKLPESATLLGLPVAWSQGVIISFGPLFALLVLISMKMESDTLEAIRTSLSPKERTLSQPKFDAFAYVLFWFPTLAGLFCAWLFVTSIVPEGADCGQFNPARYLWDFSLQSGTASKFCIRDQTSNMPWIYPPVQLYLYIIMVALSAYISALISRGWSIVRQ